MNQQVQQKTVQLQGIETLLSEASMLEHLETDADRVAAPAADVEADVAASEGVPAQESASSPAEVVAPPATARGKKTASKPSAKAKSPKSSSVKATTRKQPSTKTKTQSRSQARKTTAQPKSRALLRPKFADTSLTDAVTQVLTQAAESLHLDQLVSELYEDVSGEDLKRIKKALANVLSEGKKTGKWRNVGNGVYQIKA